MSKQLLCLISFTMVLGMTAVSPAGLDDDPNLAGWWKFDGDALDSSGNERHGTLVADAHLVDTGVLGGAVSLDGSDDEVTIVGYTGINADRTDPDNPFQKPFTVACWINTTTADGSLVNWGSSDGAGVGGQYQNFRLNGGRLRAEHGNGRFRGAARIDDGEWHHIAMVVSEGANLEPPATQLYVDGNKDTQGADTVNAQNIWNLTEDADVAIGVRASHGDRRFTGMFDDVRIYDRVLEHGEIRVLMGLLAAYAPDPAEGALIEDVSVLLGWTPGFDTVEHDVYFGTTAELGADQLLGRQAATTALATGLEKDTTHYWRVDDITADGTVITGDVWSFWVPPRSSYGPSPADGAKILDTAATLSWTGGFTPIMHNVHFGTDPAALLPVSMMQMDATYDTGPLENGTTYYWRIDEFYGTDTVEGPVWSFSTVPVLPVTDDPNLVALWTFDGDSGGIVLDQSGNGNHAVLRNDAQVIAGHGGDVLDLGEDGYGDISNLVYDANNAALPEVTVSVWIRTDSPDDQYILSFDRDENYRLEINGFGGGPGQVGWDVMTLLDGAETMVDYGSVTRVDDGEWHHVAGIFDNGTLTIYIDGFAEPSATGGPVYGTGATVTRYGLIARNSEKTSFEAGPSTAAPLLGEMDDLAIYDRAFSEDEMRQLYGNLAIAWQPEPDLGTTVDVAGVILSWTPGDGAAEHDVYLGTDAAAVAAADATDASGIYRGRQAETTLATELLEFGAAYYWRVDEVAADGTVAAGTVWPFSTAVDLTIYDVETPFDYDTSVDPFASEISLDIDPAQDWTDPIARIAVNYTGNAAPGSVTVDDVNGMTTVVGRGTDIAGTSDEFQYAYTTLTGDGTMTVKVDSLAHTHDWSKAGIMIRETLDPSSAFAAVYATGANGVVFESRAMPGQDHVSGTREAIDAPVWIKIERTFPMVSASYSTDGVAFIPLGGPQVIPMSPAPIQIGLAVTSHSGANTYAEAVFSEISSGGGVVPGPLTSVEIGLTGNAPAPMSAVLTDASGATAAVVNPDPAAVNQTSATDFIVNLADYNIDLAAVAKISLVIGDGTPGGSGSITINNVRLLGVEPPVGHWTLNGNADDSSATGADGTVVGDPVWVAGVVGDALELDGVDDYVDCGNPAELDFGTGDFTVSAWIKLTTAERATVFAKGGDNSGGIRYTLAMGESNDDKMTLTTDDNDSKKQTMGGTVVNDGEWHHVVGMRSGNTGLVYVDGVLDGTEELPEGYDLSGSSQANALIGAITDAQDPTGATLEKFFMGTIDDVRVYGRAISDAEIAKLAGL